MARITRTNYTTTGRQIDIGAGVGITGETGLGPATGLHDQGDAYWTASGAGAVCIVVGTNSAGSFLNRIINLAVTADPSLLITSA